MRTLRGALLLSSALVCLVSALASPVAAQERAPFSITLDGDRVSLSVREAVLADVLADLGKASGVAIGVNEGLAADISRERVTITLERVPLEQAVRRLLGGRDAMYL